MGIDKREIFEKLIKGNFWRNLSCEEIRLYLLLVVVADDKEGKGKINLEEISTYLNLNLNELKKAIYNLQKLDLIRINYCGGSIQFQFLFPFINPKDS